MWELSKKVRLVDANLTEVARRAGNHQRGTGDEHLWRMATVNAGRLTK
jgi:hypothetical protein